MKETNISGEKPLSAGEKSHSHPVFLMVSLFLFLLLFPVSEHLRWGGMLVRLGYSLILVSAVWAIHTNRWAFLIACALGLPWLVPAWLGDLTGSTEGLGVVATASLTVFILFLLGMMIHSVMRAEHVTRNTLFQAVSAYLMIGLAWFVMYGMVLHFDGGAFSMNTAAGIERGQPVASGLLYMSFCTLTTLGYGDITPISSSARGMAMIEATIGPLYLAILIARLVALYTREKLSDR